MRILGLEGGSKWFIVLPGPIGIFLFNLIDNILPNLSYLILFTPHLRVRFTSGGLKDMLFPIRYRYIGKDTLKAIYGIYRDIDGRLIRVSLISASRKS